MSEDKLTRAERIRLEAFAQSTARHTMRPLPIIEAIKEAEFIEQFIKNARENA